MMTRLLFCALFAVACAAPVPPASQQGQETARGDADITGVVTKVQGNEVRVEATPNEFRGAKAVVKITAATTIVGASSIREGQTVSVWYTGEVAQSYPVQAEAAEIRVH